MKLKFKKLTEDAKIPQYAHLGDAGMDVYATGVEYDAENDFFIYHTGLACETDGGYAILGMPRSSNCKTDAYLCNSVGLIDSATYRGEIQFRFKNRTASVNPYTEQNDLEMRKVNKELILKNFAPYEVGDRIGQLVVIKLPKVEVLETDKLSDTSRGEGGFGSTGKN